MNDLVLIIRMCDKHIKSISSYGNADHAFYVGELQAYRNIRDFCNAKFNEALTEMGKPV